MTPLTAPATVGDLTLREVAERLGVTRQRVQQLITGSRMAAHRGPAGMWLVHPLDLESFLSTRRGTGRPRGKWRMRPSGDMP